MVKHIANALSDVKEAFGFKNPEPVQKSSYTGRIWTNYTKRVGNTAPTSYTVPNAVAKLIVAITTIAPYIIATAVTVLADITAMTAKGISSAYGALRNKFSKPAEQGNLDKAIDFVKTNQKAIIIGSSTLASLASLGGMYYFRAEIAGGASKVATKVATFSQETYNKVHGKIFTPAKPNCSDAAWYNIPSYFGYKC